ncbi:MAG TPA: TetR/AcrR family transcriptional regulator [Anaeromyxobacteraceae bacterium]|nr:TetR/AcrR family transcriptional regulator [Anaeromyxobacteraceae bacterium]
MTQVKSSPYSYPVEPRSDTLGVETGSHKPGIAERLWEAARLEFSQRGYHGARVQGIARRAGCNVALLYRHWSSKKALYLDILRTVWQAQAREITTLLERGTGAPSVVSAYLEALLRDQVGSRVVVRELLDGAPFLTQLVEGEPALLEPVRRAALSLAPQGGANGGGQALRPGLDPVMVVLSVAGLATFVSSALGTTRLFVDRDVTPEQWRDHLRDLLLNGVVACPQ